MTIKYIYVKLDTTGDSPEQEEDILRVSLAVFRGRDCELYRESFIIHHYVPDIISYMSDERVLANKDLINSCMQSQLSYKAVDGKCLSLVNSMVNKGDTCYIVADNANIVERFVINKLPRFSLAFENSRIIDLTSVKYMLKLSGRKYPTYIPSDFILDNLAANHKLLIGIKSELKYEK